MTKHNSDWSAIRREYEADVETVEVITERHGIAAPTLYAHAAKEGWILRQSVRNTERPALIERLAKMLERQITHMEKNMTPGDAREVALLGTMARTLEKLIDLDKKGAPPNREDDEGPEMMDLRRKLAARIDQLRKA